jgi:hypothetical protein
MAVLLVRHGRDPIPMYGINRPLPQLRRNDGEFGAMNYDVRVDGVGAETPSFRIFLIRHEFMPPPNEGALVQRVDNQIPYSGRHPDTRSPGAHHASATTGIRGGDTQPV